MKLFWRIVLALVLALAGAWAWTRLAADPGYVRVVWHGWSIESTVIVAVLAAVLAWVAFRILLWAVRTPWRAWRRRGRRIARQRVGVGMGALMEGRYAQAEKLLVKASSEPELRAAALVQAARAARARGEDARAGELLEEAAAAGGADLVLLESVDALLAAGSAAPACERLEAAARDGALPPRGQELRVRALAAAGRAAEALELFPVLAKATGRGREALGQLERELAVAALAQATDASELSRRWDALGKALRAEPAVIDAFAARATRLGLAGTAPADAIEAFLKKDVDEALALRYGQLAEPAAAKRIGRAERWLEAHPDSPGLLTALGRLCRIEQLWGKANDYLERALARGGGAPAWEELARWHADQGEHERARRCLDNALALTRGETAQRLPQRARALPAPASEAPEQRDRHGIPRLAGD